ncbi:MAG: transglycosylase domain-containing protein [Ahrensia sp.]|nr:transglycosylase domain-containing protein [Ahrensia sp.]
MGKKATLSARKSGKAQPKSDVGSPKKTKWPKSRRLRWSLRGLYWGSVLGLWGLIAIAGIVAFYAAQLPSAKHWVVPERPPNVRILAADGSLLANRGLTGGEALRLEEMSPYIPQAVIAIEDRRFHLHFGFDPIGFTRAMIRNVSDGRLREGGSTITQQLAKNLFLTPERSFGRKVQELILAIWLETKYTKAQILELYLNRVYFGAGATGIDAASRRYFGKPARYVTLPEAALLAGLLKAPSRFSPANNPDLAQRRARVVLQAMQREGYVKPGPVNADAVVPSEHARHFRTGARHYVADLVMKRLEGLAGKVTQDIIVTTTVSPYLMAAAEQSLKTALDDHGQKRKVSQGALVTLSPDGAIRALIGGRDYGESGFNRAVDAKRQPGSTFKTFVWLTALENGMTPQTMMDDTPVRYGTWQPKNHNDRYFGEVELGHAFAESSNTVSARLTMQLGAERVARTAKRLGIASPLAANASIALGTSEVSLLELTSAHAPFSNGGMRAEPWIIKRVEKLKGRGKTKLVYRRTYSQPRHVVEPQHLHAMNMMLSGVIKHGTGRSAQLNGHVAGGKTGTSQNFRDALFVGHSAHMVTGVWFGNDDNSPTRMLTGGSLPAQVWNDFMTSAHRDLPSKPLPGATLLTLMPPQALAIPSRRPKRETALAALDETQTEDQIADLRDRVETVIRDRARRTILDLLTGQ